MNARRFQPGDLVIYRMTKRSVSPGPRARHIAPAAHGETYTYQVDKYWIVQEVLEGGQLLIRTRRGKTRVVASDDRKLRAPGWWESLFHRRLFPQPSSLPADVVEKARRRA